MGTRFGRKVELTKNALFSGEESDCANFQCYIIHVLSLNPM